MDKDQRDERIEELISVDGPLTVEEAEELRRLAQERRRDR